MIIDHDHLKYLDYLGSTTTYTCIEISTLTHYPKTHFEANEDKTETSSSSIDQFPLEEIAHEVMNAKVEQQQSLSSSSSLIFPEGVNVTIGALRNVRLVDLDQEKGDADEKSPKMESTINNSISSNTEPRNPWGYR